MQYVKAVILPVTTVRLARRTVTGKGSNIINGVVGVISRIALCKGPCDSGQDLSTLGAFGQYEDAGLVGRVEGFLVRGAPQCSSYLKSEKEDPVVEFDAGCMAHGFDVGDYAGEGTHGEMKVDRDH